jgi:hypothetical protein
MSNPIDEYFKRNLANQEITPSKNLFAEKIQPNIKQRKAAPFFFLRVAAALVLLLAGWMVVQLLNKPQTNPDTLDMPNPIAIEEVVPPATTPQVEEETPGETENVSMQDVPTHSVAVQQKEEAPTELTQKATEQNFEIEETPVVLAAVEAEPNPDVVAQPISAEAKKTYKVKIKIDPAKYATAKPTTNDVALATPTLKEYAKNQISNVKEGDGLQAPPKEWFELPKLAVKFEGNPLKRVLQN